MQSRTGELPSLPEYGKLLPILEKNRRKISRYRRLYVSFFRLLSEYITMKDVGVYPLSQFCGLDRSFMYKIINGKRNPSGEDVVRKMAQFMQLTPREKQISWMHFTLPRWVKRFITGANRSEN